MNWLTGLEEILIENEPLKNHTWLRIGGPARFFFRPKTIEQVKTIIKRCKENNISWKVIGQGANILVNDKGIDGAVIKLDTDGFGQIEFDNSSVVVGSAVPLPKLIQETIKKGLGGVEILVGIPGSVGGAVKVNAGGRFGDIGTVTSVVWSIDTDGEDSIREKPELTFEYRKSNITDQIIIKARLDLTPEDPQRLLTRMKETFIIKKNTQPLSSFSAGCIFKNPPDSKPAGMLIDQAGLKGYRIGGAVVSERHANFIINEGNATFEDVIQLMKIIQEKVFDKFNVKLEPEIEIWE